MNDAPIGIFDSGVGGLTVARAVSALLPRESIRYIGDTAHSPYGPKPIADVRRYGLEVLDTLVAASIRYLVGQLRAGAEAVQLFDTWAGVLPPHEFAQWSIAPTRRIVEGVRAEIPGAKIIGFPRGAGGSLASFVQQVPVDAVSIDWTAEPAFVRDRVQSRIAVQGNLDPLALLAGGDALDRAVDTVLESYGAGRLIFNLGHGILPETPIAHVERMLARVRGR